MKKQKLTTRQLVLAAMLLAIMIASQYFKNFSPYITGTVVNLCLILCTVHAALYASVILSIIAPVTAFFFTGSPIMATMPLMFPMVMMGNILICYFASVFSKKGDIKHLALGLAIGSIVKSAFMGVICVFVIFPNFSFKLIELMGTKAEMILATARITFSLTQLITAGLASVFACLMQKPISHFLKSDSA